MKAQKSPSFISHLGASEQEVWQPAMRKGASLDGALQLRRASGLMGARLMAFHDGASRVGSEQAVQMKEATATHGAGGKQSPGRQPQDPQNNEAATAYAGRFVSSRTPQEMARQIHQTWGEGSDFTRTLVHEVVRRLSVAKVLVFANHYFLFYPRIGAHRVVHHAIEAKGLKGQQLEAYHAILSQAPPGNRPQGINPRKLNKGMAGLLNTIRNGKPGEAIKASRKLKGYGKTAAVAVPSMIQVLDNAQTPIEVRRNVVRTLQAIGKPAVLAAPYLKYFSKLSALDTRVTSAQIQLQLKHDALTQQMAQIQKVIDGHENTLDDIRNFKHQYQEAVQLLLFVLGLFTPLGWAMIVFRKYFAKMLLNLVTMAPDKMTEFLQNNAKKMMSKVKEARSAIDSALNQWRAFRKDCASAHKAVQGGDPSAFPVAYRKALNAKLNARKRAVSEALNTTARSNPTRATRDTSSNNSSSTPSAPHTNDADADRQESGSDSSTSKAEKFDVVPL
ncbi:MAG: hypothetical protein AAFX99_17750 [Myxococcota bacterium]